MSEPSTKDLVAGALVLTQKHFLKGEHSKALKIAARGISIADDQYKKELQQGSPKPRYHVKYTALLDTRSACYEKLSKLEYAKLDSDRIIKMDPYSCKGYLRTAKILGLMGNQADALKVLQTGINKIESGLVKSKGKLKVNENLFNKIKDERDRLIQTLDVEIVTEEKSSAIKRSLDSGAEYDHIVIKKIRREIHGVKDPLKVLPFELISTIFKNLDQSSILKSMLVTSSWHKIITSIPQLLETPILKKQITPVEFDKFLAFYKKINKGRKSKLIKTIDLGDMSRSRGDEIKIVTKFLTSGFIIKNFKLGLGVTDNITFTNIINNSVDARRLMASAEDIFLSFPVTNPNRWLNDMLTVLPEQINSIGFILTPTTFGVREREEPVYTAGGKRKFLNLKKLVIATADSNNNTWARGCLTTSWIQFTSMPNLEYLRLFQADVPDGIFQRYLASLPNLDVLVVDSMFACSLQNLLHSLSIIEVHFKLTKFQFINDTSITTGPEHLRIHGLNLSFFQNLNQLVLRSTKISTEGLMKILVSTNNNLESLTLDFNTNLVFKRSSFDPYAPGGLVNFTDLLDKTPKLKYLSLVGSTNLTDYSLKQLSVALVECHPPIKTFKSLLLSNNDVTGVGVLDLFQRGKSWLKLDLLDVKGCDIRPETARLLIKEGYSQDVKL